MFRISGLVPGTYLVRTTGNDDEDRSLLADRSPARRYALRKPALSSFMPMRTPMMAMYVLS